MAVIIFISFMFSLLPINAVFQTIICSDNICDFGICNAWECHHNNYICTDTVTECIIKCNDHCLDINITSSAQSTYLECRKGFACQRIDINILEPTNRFTLQCQKQNSCKDITIDHPYPYISQCNDFQYNICNDNVFGDWTPYRELTPSPTPSPTNNPTPAPTGSPTAGPTSSPTGSPTKYPTESPTEHPTQSTSNPTPDVSTSTTMTSTTTSPRTSTTSTRASELSTSTSTTADGNDSVFVDGNDNDSKSKSDMTIVIICVVAFWIGICISVPLYIRYWKRKTETEESMPTHITLQNMASSGSSVNRHLKDLSPSEIDNEKAVKNMGSIPQPPNAAALGMPGFVTHRPHASSEGLIRQLQLQAVTTGGDGSADDEHIAVIQEEPVRDGNVTIMEVNTKENEEHNDDIHVHGHGQDKDGKEAEELHDIVSDDESKCDYDKLYEGGETRKRGGNNGKGSESNMSLYVRSYKATPDGPTGGLRHDGNDDQEVFVSPSVDPVSPNMIYSAMTLDLPNTPPIMANGKVLIEVPEIYDDEEDDMDNNNNNHIPTEAAILGSLSDDNLDGLYGKGGTTRGQFVE